jgi:hypothetical protein
VMKPRKTKTGEPSLRDRLSASFLRAFESDFEVHGVNVIEQMRQKAPEKYAELAARLIAVAEEPPSAGDFSKCETMQDIGRKLLEQIGLSDPDDDAIAEAVQLNDGFVSALEAIRDRASAETAEDKSFYMVDKSTVRY